MISAVAPRGPSIILFFILVFVFIVKGIDEFRRDSREGDMTIGDFRRPDRGRLGDNRAHKPNQADNSRRDEKHLRQIDSAATLSNWRNRNDPGDENSDREQKTANQLLTANCPLPTVP